MAIKLGGLSNEEDKQDPYHSAVSCGTVCSICIQRKRSRLERRRWKESPLFGMGQQ